MIESYDGVAPFRVVTAWEQLPEGFSHLDVSDVAVGDDDTVYVLTRFESRVLVYDRAGQFLGSWGEGAMSDRPHGITVAPDETLYIVDESDHLVRHMSRNGEVLEVIGPGRPAESGYDHDAGVLFVRLQTIERGAGPFNRPTKVAVAPSGDLYVTDGYGNARVHQFRRDGRLIRSWGEPGTSPGQFRVPHCVVATCDGRLLVADRENDRLQVFDLEGRFIAEWTDVQRPTAIAEDRDGNFMVAELAWLPGDTSIRFGPISTAIPARLSLLDAAGRVLGRWTELSDGRGPGGLVSPHGLALDSTGALYVGEVNHSFATGHALPTTGLNTLQKFVRADEEID